MLSTILFLVTYSRTGEGGRGICLKEAERAAILLGCMTPASYVEISVGEHPGISGTRGGWLNIPNARSHRFSEIPSRIVLIVVVVVRIFYAVHGGLFIGLELLVLRNSSQPNSDRSSTTTSNDALVLTNCGIILQRRDHQSKGATGRDDRNLWMIECVRLTDSVLPLRRKRNADVKGLEQLGALALVQIAAEDYQ